VLAPPKGLEPLTY